VEGIEAAAKNRQHCCTAKKKDRSCCPRATYPSGEIGIFLAPVSDLADIEQWLAARQGGTGV
jgi:hypothetical protein